MFEWPFARREADGPMRRRKFPSIAWWPCREAFIDVANGKAFIAGMEQRGGSIERLTAEERKRRIARFHRTPQQVVRGWHVTSCLTDVR